MYIHWFVCECIPVCSLVSKLLLLLSTLICPLLVFSFICRAGFVLALGCYLPSPVCICIKCIEKKKTPPTSFPGHTGITSSLTKTHFCLRAGGYLAIVAQWQSTGCSSQRCPGFDSRRLPAFSLSSIFAS